MPADGTTPSPELLELIDGTEGLDPRMAAVLRLVMSRTAEGTPMPVAAQEGLDELRANVARLEASNRALLVMLDRLAAALGACPECWGGHLSCRCGGMGHPGAFPPERLAFEAFVLPVIRTLGARIAANAPRRPPATTLPFPVASARFHRET